MRCIVNPPNPYLKYSSEFLGEPPNTKLEIFEETSSKTIISKNNSPDVGFNFSVNCYRGCIHGCTYCFARPYHEYLGYGAGTDFETKIVAKVNAPFLLRQELKKPSMRGQYIGFSFATDPYLQIEANYELTRRCLMVCADFAQPVGVITKSALITRDIDVFLELQKRSTIGIFITIPFLTKEQSNPFEPYAPVPDVRFKAMKKLADAGLKVGMAIAPVIPGYNDSDIPLLLEKARDHGATSAFMNLLRLPTESVRSYFIQRLNERLSTKADKVLNQIKRERGGKLNNSNFGERMKGTTERWRMALNLFNMHHKKLGFERHERPAEIEAKFEGIQPSLF